MGTQAHFSCRLQIQTERSGTTRTMTEWETARFHSETGMQTIHVLYHWALRDGREGLGAL